MKEIRRKDDNKSLLIFDNKAGKEADAEKFIKLMIDTLIMMERRNIPV
jgi:hypothetical protein